MTKTVALSQHRLGSVLVSAPEVQGVVGEVIQGLALPKVLLMERAGVVEGEVVEAVVDYAVLRQVSGQTNALKSTVWNTITLIGSA